MRAWSILVIVLLLPSASAASGVHLTHVGDAYAVTYATSAGELRTERIPFDAGSYTVEGKRYPLAAPPGPNDSTRVAFVADMGTDGNASAIARAIANASPDLVLVGGDLSYAHGDLRAWARWFEIVEPVASRVPLMPVIGNHEAYCEPEPGHFTGCGLAPNRWREHFPLPNKDEPYYAFDWGPLHVIGLDTEAYEGEATTDRPAQNAFARGELANDSGRWELVMFHRPLRTTNLHEEAAADQARADLMPILDGHADLVLQAHVHAYERAAPTDAGTLFVTSGGGGRQLYDEWSAMEPWVAKRAAEHHFLLLDITPARIEGKALRADGSVLDAFALSRPVPASPTPASPSPAPSTPTLAASTPVAPSGNANGSVPGANNSSVEEANEAPLPAALLPVALVAALLIRRARR